MNHPFTHDTDTLRIFTFTNMDIFRGGFAFSTKKAPGGPRGFWNAALRPRRATGRTAVRWKVPAFLQQELSTDRKKIQNSRNANLANIMNLTSKKNENVKLLYDFLQKMIQHIQKKLPSEVFLQGIIQCRSWNLVLIFNHPRKKMFTFMFTRLNLTKRPGSLRESIALFDGLSLPTA